MLNEIYRTETIHFPRARRIIKKSQGDLFVEFGKNSKSLFCSGVFLKGSAFAVGLWNPKKGFRSVTISFVFLLDFFVHQSIPAAPCPPPPGANAGHLPVLSVPGVGL